MFTDKYRPLIFDNVIGQKGIDIIRSYVGEEKIPGLWIFSGPRGVGKTSTARIFALALNCKNRDSKKNPCLKCESCTDILKGVGDLVLEVDGASYRGIDEIRRIKDIVNLRSRGKRVIIIDEAGQLTDAAFNSLLKVTEEPPPSTIFILPTTKAGKIIETIKDRAVNIEFSRVTENLLVQHLRALAKEEGVEHLLSSDIVESILAKSDGSVRSVVKGIDIFTSLVKSGKEKDFAEIFVGTDKEELEVEIVKAFLSRRIAQFAKLTEELESNGYSPIEILISIYSGILTVGLREKGLTRFKGSEKFAGVTFDRNNAEWFVNKFPGWLSILREFPSRDLLVKLVLESICFV